MRLYPWDVGRADNTPLRTENLLGGAIHLREAHMQVDDVMVQKPLLLLDSFTLSRYDGGCLLLETKGVAENPKQHEWLRIEGPAPP